MNVAVSDHSKLRSARVFYILLGLCQINATVKLTKIDEKAVRTVLQGYKIHNCDLMIRQDVRL